MCVELISNSQTANEEQWKHLTAWRGGRRCFVSLTTNQFKLLFVLQPSE